MEDSQSLSPCSYKEASSQTKIQIPIVSTVGNQEEARLWKIKYIHKNNISRRIGSIKDIQKFRKFTQKVMLFKGSTGGINRVSILAGMPMKVLIQMVVEIKRYMSRASMKSQIKRQQREKKKKAPCSRRREESEESSRSDETYR